MNHLRIKIIRGKSLLFFLFVCYSQLIGGFQLILNSGVWAIILQTLIVVLLIYFFLSLHGREKLICLGYPIGLFAVLFLFPETPALTSSNGIPMSLQLTSGFIGFYIGYLCLDHSNIRDTLKAVAVFMFIYNVWDFASGRASDVGAYNMNFGFKAMFTSIIAIYLSFSEETKWKRIAWMVIGLLLFVFIIIIGSRGPVLGVISIMALTYGSLFILNPNIRKDRKILSVIAIIAAIILYFSFSDQILAAIGRMLGSIGLDVSSSRNWNKILTGSLFSDINRQNLWTSFINDFNWFGHGAYSSWYYKGNYPHDFFIEVIFDFGRIFGGLFIIIFLLMVIFTIIHLREREEYALFVILLAYFIGRLITSFTFWWDTYFWMLIGVMSKYIFTLNRSYKIDAIAESEA